MNSKQSTYHPFLPSGCLSHQGMSAFMEKRLSPTDQSAVDRHLATCSLCSDAYEGLKLLDPEIPIQHVLSELKLELKSNTHRKSHFRIPVRKQKDRIFYLSAAASIVILIGLLFALNQHQGFSFDKNRGAVVIINEKAIPPKPEAIQKVIKQQEEALSLPIKEAHTDGTIKNEPKESPSFRRNKQKDSPLEIPQDLASATRGLEAYMKEHDEKTITKSKRQKIQYIDIASTLPPEYYLSEIIIEGPGQSENINSSGEHDYQDPQHASNQSSKDQLNTQLAQSPVARHFFNPLETMPEFQGGLAGLNKYLSKNLKYPGSSRDQKVQGRVIVSFLIDVDGSVKNVTVLHGLDSNCNREAIRVIRSMPNWKPAYQNNQPVSVQFTLPIHFKII